MLLLQFFFSTLGSLLDSWSTWIAKAQDACYFIKCFTGSVVTGTPKQCVMSMSAHEYKLAMSTRNDQADQGEQGITWLVRCSSV